MLPNDFPVCLKEEAPGLPPTPHIFVFVFPFSSSFKNVTLSQNQGHGKRKASHISDTCFRGKHKQEHMYCIPGAGKLSLKSATYKESSHPDASHISSATQKAQPRSTAWVQNEPVQEGLCPGNGPCFAWSH